MSRRLLPLFALACLLAFPGVASAAPDTSITGGPSGTTSSRDAGFTFASTEEGTFQCQLDAGDVTDCTSGVSYGGLADGQHTFRVWARDTGGDPDPTPAVRTWTVDTAAPDTSIVAAPRSEVTITYAQFRFASTEEEATFRCQVDAGVAGACPSPYVIRNLAGGAHTLRVWASDAAGNEDLTPAEHRWTVTGQPGPEEPPPPVEEVFGESIVLAAGKLKVRRRSLLLRTRCPAGQARCAGRITVRAGRKRIGVGLFRLVDGQRATLRVRLSRKRLRRIRLIRRVRITAVTNDASGNRATKSWVRGLKL